MGDRVVFLINHDNEIYVNIVERRAFILKKIIDLLYVFFLTAYYHWIDRKSEGTLTSYLIGKLLKDEPIWILKPCQLIFFINYITAFYHLLSKK